MRFDTLKMKETIFYLKSDRKKQLSVISVYMSVQYRALNLKKDIARDVKKCLPLVPDHVSSFVLKLFKGQLVISITGYSS